MKRCAACREEKPFDDFYRDNSNKRDGRQSRCKECSLRYNAIWEATNKERRRHQPSRYNYRATYEQRFKRKLRGYGITQAEYDAMLMEQDYKCAICGSDEWGRKGVNRIPSPCIDHDHTTGKVRGLLCTWCNSLLGYAREQEAIMTNAMAYLRERA